MQSKILFDMNGGTVKGFAITPEELPFFQDIFESVDPSQNIKASYLLQFIWRDLTSSYSIIGPHFACEKSWDHSFLYDCVMRTVKLFSLYKFRVKVLVCDGASSNLALLKVLAGYKACQIPVKEEGTGIERYLPKMTFSNPNLAVAMNILLQVVLNAAKTVIYVRGDRGGKGSIAKIGF